MFVALVIQSVLGSGSLLIPCLFIGAGLNSRTEPDYWHIILIMLRV